MTGLMRFLGRFAARVFRVVSACCGLAAGTVQAAGEGWTPVIFADVPDNSILRVGDLYYMSSTTMHMSPGVPIMKSRDLVNWDVIGHACGVPMGDGALALQEGRDAYGAGSWASSLRHHGGIFYATTFSRTTGMTHVYRTRDIEKGPWRENRFRPALHDHSLFFDDDGRVYMVYGCGDLRLIELEADVSGVKRGGVDQVIVTNASRVAGPRVGLPAEGSQIWKIRGKYYLFNITWPPGGMRTEILHRADKLTGPYEGRVFLRDSGIAQGGLVDTPGGGWFAYMFQDHGAVGRVPHIIPVEWRDGWPVAGGSGTVAGKLDIPAGGGRISGIVAPDEFDREPGAPPLPPVWQWNHDPDSRHWSVSARPGFLRLTTGRVDAGFLSARNSLTQRTFGPECSGSVALELTAMKDGDFAGLGLLQKNFGCLGVRQSGDGRQIVVARAEGVLPGEVVEVPVSCSRVYLKVECDFKDRADLARFYHSMDGKQWTQIGKPLSMVYTLPHFMGYRFAIFNYATKTAGGFVDFDYFRVGNKLTTTNGGEMGIKN